MQKETNSNNQNQDYIVLARKYRPQNFDDLIGHKALVQTLQNALDSNRLAHAFILTGVRGVGKTTTARIIAKGLNCIGKDGKGKETLNPCGVCEHCLAIANDNHLDVIEMDAASQTGVDDVRNIIDNVKYQPASSRYKIYIIDEVHMLSNAAFNALLKTLEEPPAYVKFIFATTEIRKLPITVLSRCQRFDLKRITLSDLEQHLKKITDNEGTKIEDAALRLIALAADGSVRDGISILDRAISYSDGDIKTADIQEMLGFSSKSAIVELFLAMANDDTNLAMQQLQNIYNEGVEPYVILEDLMTLVNIALKYKLSLDKEVDFYGYDIEAIEKITNINSAAQLSWYWQMLLKGYEEIKVSHSAALALEMVILRVLLSMQLPSPDIALKWINDNKDSIEKKNS